MGRVLADRGETFNHGGLGSILLRVGGMFENQSGRIIKVWLVIVLHKLHNENIRVSQGEMRKKKDFEC